MRAHRAPAGREPWDVRHHNGNITRGCQILITAMCGFAPLFAGCDECTLGQTHCEGDARLDCYPPEDGVLANNTLHRVTCSVTCHEADGKANCVDTRAPIPECAGGNDDICLDGVPTSCVGGYPSRHSQCEGPTHCMLSATCFVAICAIDDKVSPNCSFDPSCDGGVLTTCQCDLVVARQDCGAADLCRKVGSYSRCTETAAPDPRCGDPPPLSSNFCDGDTVVGCGHGYTESHIDCGSVGYTCGVTGGQASCEAPRTGP